METNPSSGRTHPRDKLSIGPRGSCVLGTARGTRDIQNPARMAPVVTLETDFHQRGRQGCKPTAGSRAGGGRDGGRTSERPAHPGLEGQQWEAQVLECQQKHQLDRWVGSSED